MNRETEIESYFLCRRSSVQTMMAQAEKERDQILKEFKAFYTGDIGIRVYAIQHVMGASIAGELTVNGETCRHYDPIDLCFLDLNELMMQRMIAAGTSPMGFEKGGVDEQI